MESDDMNMVTISILIAIGLAIIGVAGDFFIKLAGNGTNFIQLKWFIIGFIIYASTAVGWFFVMKYIKLSTIGVFYSITTILLLTLVGVFYFKENINTLEIIGIIFAIISLILLAKVA
ncbi:MAG: transporter [Nanoarchaeota archaeon]|nr:transporter [Nanoarchaeota archaeon]